MASKKKDAPVVEATEIRGLKGFDPDWRCYGGFQYRVGETYTVEGDINVCHNGLHACDGSPFDVWGYFGPVGDDGRLNRFAETISSGKISRKTDDSDSKFAATKITIEAEVKFPEFIRRGISWLIENTKGKDNNGNYAQIGSSGDSARIGSSGDSAQIGSSGNYAQIGSSGYSAQIVAEGKGAVIACAGSATVTAGKGAAICIPYHDGKRTRFAVGYVGEDGIRAGVAYVVRDGKLAEA
jgi:hypothetical protein